MKPFVPLASVLVMLCAGPVLAHAAKHRTSADAADDAAVAAANKAALQQPSPTGYLNAIQIYPFMEGAVYRLVTAPEQVSDVTLQPGEQLVAISSGDTARWVIGDTTSGSGTSKQVHILVKPYTAGLKTNLVVTTSLRTYHIEMESKPQTAMTAISWSYPQDALIAAKAAKQKAADDRPVATGLVPADLHFNYAITGDNPAWRPVRAFDDGSKVYIEFPATIAQGEAPPLFVIGDDGKAELVNYRVDHTYYVVDRLFAVAELRLGEKHQAVVRITREGPPPAQRASVAFAGSARGGAHD